MIVYERCVLDATTVASVLNETKGRFVPPKKTGVVPNRVGVGVCCLEHENKARGLWSVSHPPRC